jgi:8-oxo-dGTP diphosphatase
MSSVPIAAMLDVAVGILHRADGRVLLAERPPGKPWSGYWEFPGGKIESGENAATALARELHEELGIELDAAYPWLTRVYAYPEKTVRLHFLRVSRWHGVPHGREGQQVAWEDPAAVTVAPLLPANDAVMRALALPPVYAITDVARYGVSDFMVRLEAALARGVRLIQVRERDMAAAALARFARDVVALGHPRGARVLINGDAALAREVGADGVHLRSDQLMRESARPRAGLCAASCHDAQELAQAADLHADFVVLSPVLPTRTHPDAPGMGWARFAALAADSPVPVYALGGMQLTALDVAMRHGAHGIALRSGIW